jgi:dTDP-4-dehydrorhamnose 3,5-epimerase/CDP-3, 6-dideoxy-D-glycero-D-glycero-4-hexulose-5-epimerase
MGITMIIQDTFIEGLKLIRLKRFDDQRGSFVKIFNAGIFNETGLDFDLKESYFSVSAKGVVRGMHFQVPPSEHIKLVYLSRGLATDVVLDIRKNSKTFGRYFTTELNEADPVMVYIPAGCAHGFASQEDDTIVTYLQTSVYDPKNDMGIRFDSFGFEWETKNPIVSDRDLRFPSFNEFDSPF